MTPCNVILSTFFYRMESNLSAQEISFLVFQTRNPRLAQRQSPVTRRRLARLNQSKTSLRQGGA